MILLEITNSPDQEILGEYKTFKNDILIGQHLHVDFPIADPQLEDVHAIIRLNPKTLFIKTLPNKTFFILNGKKFSGEKKLSTGDTITIGQTSIRIANFNYDPQSSPGDFKEYYKKAITKFPETSILLEVLEREIAYLTDSGGEE